MPTHHRHELLAACRVDRDRVVEVLLRRAHLDRDGEALRHLVRAVADDVDADDLLQRPLADELARALDLVLLIGQEALDARQRREAQGARAARRRPSSQP